MERRSGVPAPLCDRALFESFKNGRVFGLMVDGDEFCFRLVEHGGRVKMVSVLGTDFRNVSEVTNRNHREIMRVQGAAESGQPQES